MTNTVFKSLILILSVLFFVVTSANSQSGNLSYTHQIKAAVSPAPDDLQKEAEVKGYNEEGTLVTLRDGSNELICLADDPRQSNFHVACYHKDLEPFMKRGRELKAKGMPQKKINKL